MKKWSLLLVGMLLSVGLFSSVGFAYNPAKQHARQAYRTTAQVLMEAQDAARMGHNYQGLGRAFSHHRLARDYYYTRDFQISVHHSLRARQIAYNVIERNSYGMNNSYRTERCNGFRRRGHGERFDDFEMRYSQNMSQDDLDARAARNNNNNNNDNDDNDEVSMKVKINFNL